MDISFAKTIVLIFSLIGVFCTVQMVVRVVMGKILRDIEKLDPNGAKGVKDREEKLRYIGKVVAFLEFVFFSALSLRFLYSSPITDPNIMNFLTVFAGWLAIKMIPSYWMWSDKVVGKAYFYRSFFGTLISVTSAVFAGYIMTLIFSFLTRHTDGVFVCIPRLFMMCLIEWGIKIWPRKYQNQKITSCLNVRGKFSFSMI